jgi:hypothetical protein
VISNLFKLAAVLGLCLALTSCGKYTFEDIYRYPCQDPANWESPECLPPNCEAFGVCTKDVMRGTPLYDEDSEREAAENANAK